MPFSWSPTFPTTILNITTFIHSTFDTLTPRHRYTKHMLLLLCRVTGVRLALSLLAVDGIGQWEFGRKDEGGLQKCITRSGCRGELSYSFIIILNPCTKVATYRVSSIFSAVARFVLLGSDSCSVRHFPCSGQLENFLMMWYPAHDTYRSLCIRLRNSRVQCWRRDGSRKREGGSTRGSGKVNQSWNGTRCWSRSKHDSLSNCCFIVRSQQRAYPSIAPELQKLLMSIVNCVLTLFWKIWWVVEMLARWNAVKNQETDRFSSPLLCDV